MSKLVQGTALAAAAFAASGCAAWNTLESQARVDPRSVAAYRASGAPPVLCDINRLKGDAYDVPINLDCFRFPEQRGSGEIAYVKAATDTTFEARNRLASILMKHSDDICVKEMGDVSAREAIANTALGTATSALSGLGAIVTGERIKSWLAGAAGFTNATRDHINAEVFRNILASALAKAVQNDRDARRKKIEGFFKTGKDKYSVDQMVADVNRYHQSCSFYNGLVMLVDAVNRASPGTATEYRDLTAAISDLTVEINELEARIAVTKDPTARTSLQAEHKQLTEQRTLLRVQRSNLVSPNAEPATGKVDPPKTEGQDS